MNAVVTDTRRAPGVTVQPVPIEAVRIGDGFWRGWLDRLYDVTLPTQHAQCEATGRLDNIRRVSGRVEAPFRGRYYDESDVYKWLEAASWALAGREDRRLRSLVDALVDDIAAAQQPDGYVHTYFALERADQRYSDLINKHELYCAGHLIQAGIAHHRATGAETLLDVAVRLADHICAEFGPDARETADGHPEIELALVELARETGRRVYAEQARFFLGQRGRQPPRLGGYRYLQDHEPAAEQQEISGHAVRAIYLACGLADAGLELEDRALWEAAERLWRSAYETKVYLSGGLGAHWAGESFGDAFDLPNRNSYAESCAAVAGVMWNWRLLAGTGEAALRRLDGDHALQRHAGGAIVGRGALLLSQSAQRVGGTRSGGMVRLRLLSTQLGAPAREPAGLSLRRVRSCAVGAPVCGGPGGRRRAGRGPPVAGGGHGLPVVG